MYKVSVPISASSIRDNDIQKDLDTYYNYFKQGNVERVFIAVIPGVYTTAFEEEIASDKFKTVVRFFKEKGFETGIWIGGFGHGSNLSTDNGDGFRGKYQKMTGVLGESFEHGYCPSDENFANDYLKSVRQLAELNPDIIMIDDDFRMNIRPYYLGCFCPNHLKEYYEILCEEIPREKIKELIMTGGKNKYRDAYMKMTKNTLLSFAEKIRKVVDKVNPDIRLGASYTPCAWDLEGTDYMEIAKVFAGKTRPFVRCFGAPYHEQHNIINAVDAERMELSWAKNNDNNICGEDEIEVFAEGDVYPRPRYNVNAKCLELFDIAMSCEEKSDGILKYMFDYEIKVGYECGYIQNHIKNLEKRTAVQNIFKNKKLTGISVFSEMHKFRNWDISENVPQGTEINGVIYDNVYDVEISSRVEASELLSQNSVPISFDKTAYPVIVTGENAKYIPLERLKNGAVLDITAAKILQQRGIDTGVLSSERKDNLTDEYYGEFDDIIHYNGNVRGYAVKCNDNAKVLSSFLPGNTPASYLYENSDGIRFLVYCFDFCFTQGVSGCYNNYYRQEQLTSAVEWVGQKKLPIVLKKNPNLYIMTAKSKDENALSVLLINSFTDDIYAPVAKLDGEYKTVKFVNGNGELKGNKLYLNDISPYGFVAFELQK